VQALAPEIRIIAATGLEPGEKRTELRALGVNTILMKPYTPQSILAAVNAEVGAPEKPV
jgi:CheY-like chemotaxis protein